MIGLSDSCGEGDMVTVACNTDALSTGIGDTAESVGLLKVDVGCLAAA